MPVFKFDPAKSIISCHVALTGRHMKLSLKLALDTGATYTMIPFEAAVAIGCNPLKPHRKMEIMTGSGIEYVSTVLVPRFEAFGIAIKNMEVVCHNLPSPSPIEGLLGLNFMTRAKLTINFSKNIISTP